MLERVRAISAIILRVGIGSTLIVVVLASAAGGYFLYTDKQEKAAKEQFAKSLSGQVREFEVPAYRGNVTLRTKFETDERLSYGFSFVADDGFKVDEHTKGEFTIEFLDKSGFLLQKSSISDFSIAGCSDGALETLCAELSSRGSFSFSADQYPQIDHIEISHNLSLKTITPKPTTPKAVTRTETVSMAPPGKESFDGELDMWDAKTRSIRIGMTYLQMIAVAGQPRTDAINNAQELMGGFDAYKYNYGHKWVFFKNNLVAAIR